MESHLLQMRGLKLCEEGQLHPASVASFTDAWIETQTVEVGEMFQVASFTDAWIETRRWCIETLWPWVASFTDAWIETPASQR